MNLLLIDDEHIMLEMLSEAVAEVLPSANRACFTNAKEGLDYSKNAPIDIAFLDINLIVFYRCFCYPLFIGIFYKGLTK